MPPPDGGVSGVWGEAPEENLLYLGVLCTFDHFWVLLEHKTTTRVLISMSPIIYQNFFFECNKKKSKHTQKNETIKKSPKIYGPDLARRHKFKT